METTVAYAPKILSGVDVLDESWGGLYRGGSYLIYGRAATGRGLITMLFTQTGAMLEEKCLFISPDRPKDLMIQAASMGFNLREAYEASHVQLLRIPPMLNLEEIGDEGVAKALNDLVSIIRQKRPNRLVINDFMPFVQFRSFERFRAAFVQMLEQIDSLDTTLMLIMAEPANQQSKKVIEFMRNQMTGSIHIELLEGEEIHSTKRRLTLIPNIGHIKRRVVDYWDLEDVVDEGSEPQAPGVRMLPEPGARGKAEVPPSEPHLMEKVPTSERRERPRWNTAPAEPARPPQDVFEAPVRRHEAYRYESPEHTPQPSFAPQPRFEPPPQETPAAPEGPYVPRIPLGRQSPAPTPVPPEEVPTYERSRYVEQPSYAPPQPTAPQPRQAPEEAPQENPYYRQAPEPQAFRQAPIYQPPAVQAPPQYPQPPQAPTPPMPQRPPEQRAPQAPEPAAPPPQQVTPPQAPPQPAPPVRSEPPIPSAPQRVSHTDRDAFRTRLQQHFLRRDVNETPFLLVAMRMDRSDGRSARPFDFEFILDLVSELLRREDDMFVELERERLIVLLADSRSEDAQRFFALLKNRLREEAPQQAEHLLHSVSAIVVPDGRPFQNAEEFLTYALDEA